MQRLQFGNLGAHGLTVSDLQSSDLTSHDLNAYERDHIANYAKFVQKHVKTGEIEIKGRKKCCCIRESLNKLITRDYLEEKNKKRKLKTALRLSLLEDLQENRPFNSPTKDNFENSFVSSREFSIRSEVLMQGNRQERRDSLRCKEFKLTNSERRLPLATSSNRNRGVEELDGYIASSESVSMKRRR